MAKKKAKKVETVSLKDLIGQGESNAELHKNDEAKRKWHKRYRTPRNRLMRLKGSEYTRPLASNPDQDLKYHELVREFVNNGMKQTNAYAAVYGVCLKTASKKAPEIFASTWMRQKIREYMLGTDGEYDDLPREWLITRLMNMIDNNILDYIADDGTYLNVQELKALPEWVQQQIKRLNIRNETIPVAMKDETGAMVYDDDGQPRHVEVRQQHVMIELYDKQKAMEHLAKVMQWITSNVDVSVNVINADTMTQAESRVRKLRREDNNDIEGEAKRIASD